MPVNNVNCEVRANNDPFSPPLGCLNDGYSVELLPKIIKEGLNHSYALQAYLKELQILQ